ncbi:MAG: hypothetical protein B7X31_12900 [Thiomonas sp. 13-66-29]|nr:MAG: hypothetical protein B7X31_12900 [Thiomonas sp. 13-66-29]
MQIRSHLAGFAYLASFVHLAQRYYKIVSVHVARRLPCKQGVVDKKTAQGRAGILRSRFALHIEPSAIGITQRIKRHAHHPVSLLLDDATLCTFLATPRGQAAGLARLRMLDGQQDRRSTRASERQTSPKSWMNRSRWGFGVEATDIRTDF